MRTIVPRFPTALVLAIIPGIATALEIRNYSPSRHDRFVTGVSGLEINPAAYYNPALYTGVGFGTNTNDVRQFALVTPEHVVFAKHFSFGGNIRFINTDGTAIDRSLGATTEVPNGSGGVSDVLLMKLSAPITEAHKITPFPYLNLASEALYNNMVLTTFGQTTRAGRGVISTFTNFSSAGPPVIQSTRAFTFRYNTITGNQDDSYAVVGDSGSPTFGMANGKPALVGIHLAVSQVANLITTTDSFVPHYAATINGLLAPEGYQLIPATAAAVTLSAGETHNPLRQTFPGTVDISLSNASAATATNVRMEFIFPAEAIPTGLSAPGWIIENPSPGSYFLRRATLAGNASTTLTASYSSIPVVTEISVNIEHRSDGSPELSQTFDLPVQPTFAGFVAALPLQGEADDPDLDGFSNLIEYAFGGDPGTNSALGSGGQSITPMAVSENGSVTYCFPRRTDAVERNLTYEIEFSATLEEMSWDTATPSGFSLNAAPYDPDVAGFEKVTATFPNGSPEKQFVRVKVNLTE